MPSISQDDRARIAQAICSLADDQDGFTKGDITDRVGMHHRKIKDFMSQYGPEEQPQYWKRVGAPKNKRQTITTSGKMIFDNLAGNFVSANIGNSGIPHLDSPEDSPNDISKEERLSAAVDILIKRYEVNWVGDVSLSYEWGSWPEWFILNRLPWLVSEDFFWPTNRSGSLPRGGRSSEFYGYHRSDELTVLSLADLAINQCSE